MTKRLVSIMFITCLILIGMNQTGFAGGISYGYSDNGHVLMDTFEHAPGLDYVLDQFQESLDQGAGFDDTHIQWQEFIPTLDNLDKVDLFLQKMGSPGDVIVEIRDETGGVTINQQIIPEASVPSYDWVSVDFPLLSLTPGEVYRIYVYSTQGQAWADAYFWFESSESEYCPKCTSSSGMEGFDFTFRTWGYGIWRVTNADFDGCGDTNLSVFKVEPWGGMWYLKDQAAYGYGNSDSIPVPRDYDGDRHMDVAVYNDGTWYVKDQFVDTWGDASSVPVPGDYDGDGDADLAVFKVEPWGGMWYIKDQTSYGYGNSGSIPVPGDYDGDGETDIAVYNDGTWYIKDQFVDTWGDSSSIPVPGDYDGDGIADLAVFKVEPWGGMWYIKDQSAHGYGNSDSIPVPGDYDGDGTTDIAVYNDGTWYVKDQFVDIWGDASSYPLPAPDTNGDGDPYQ